MASFAEARPVTPRAHVAESLKGALAGHPQNLADFRPARARAAGPLHRIVERSACGLEGGGRNRQLGEKRHLVRRHGASLRASRSTANSAQWIGGLPLGVDVLGHGRASLIPRFPAYRRCTPSM